ncbi:MAG: recombinase RecA [Anaerolineae bacterium]|nr:recombinase RecA [Anaerolineae bacterium]MCB9132756.1 recombinase RecA [Anaerolineales bacterium]MCB9143462.1 recombinase RecA [Anaerolineales bacterium]MCO5245884.1 recombinase RecA [Anaerolineae bacterium]
MAGDGKQKALDSTLANLKKRFGEGAIMKLGDAASMKVEAIPTGSLSLDLALGIGGIPRGRVIEIYGPESSGKTTICLHVIAEAQRLGGTCAFVDVEHALDPNYASRIGVNVDDLYVSQPDTGEQALEIAEALVRSGAMDVVVVDSVAALVPRAEIEGDMGDSHMGLQARLMSQALRKLSGAISQSNTAMIFTNQLRQKIGVMFGNPETTTGGMALKFYASVRLDVRRIQSLKHQGAVIGNRTRVTVKKNKVAPPFRQAEFDIMYNEGISRSGDVLDLAVEHEIVSKRGAFYSFGDTRLGQGRENAKIFLQENQDMFWQIDGLLRDQAGLARTLVPEGGESKIVAMPTATPVKTGKRASMAVVEDVIDDGDEDFDEMDEAA